MTERKLIYQSLRPSVIHLSCLTLASVGDAVTQTKLIDPCLILILAKNLSHPFLIKKAHFLINSALHKQHQC